MSLKKSIFFGIFLVLTVLFSNLFLIQDFFGYGLANEDIPFLRDYKSDNRIVDDNYLVRVYKTWVHTGPSWAHQILYVGTLDAIFPYNWELTHTLNFTWKILATLSIFPVLWVLTKRRFLATLVTLIYAILPSSNGSLQINITGTEYWGVIFLNLFIISYYFLIRDQKNFKLLVLSFILLYVAIFSAPLRMTPALGLLVITEIIIAMKGVSKLKTVVLRIIIYLVPFYLLVRLVDPGTLSRGNPYSNLFKDLFAGNWQLMINPLAGLGFTLIAPDSVRFFGIYGPLNFRNMEMYFGNLFSHGVIPLFLILTFILGSVISQKPKRFIVTTFTLSTFFQFLIYIFNTHYFYIPQELALPYNGTIDFAVLPAIIGAYILSIALATGFEWYKTGMRDKILLAIFISPLFSLAFIFATWLLIGKHYAYEDPVQRYLTVPAVGVSIFISSILILVFKRIKTTKRATVLYTFSIIIFIIYLISFSYKGNQRFKHFRSLGEDMAVQKHIQEVFYNTTPALKRDNLIIYYEPRLKTDEDKYWYTALNYGRGILWIYLQKYYNKPDRKVNGCLDWVDSGFETFKKIYKYSNNQITFNTYTAFCTKDSVTNTGVHTFYQDDFFAFTLNRDQVVDITEEVIERLHRELDNNTNPL